MRTAPDKILAIEQHFAVGIQSFESRVSLQKIVYLTQALGVRMGYRYSWYLHGPYSPELTSDAYELQNTEKRVRLDQAFTEGEQKSLERLSKAIRDLSNESDVLSSDWLEALASLHWIGNKWNWNEGFACREFRKRKPDLQARYDTALQTLKDLGVWPDADEGGVRPV